MRRYLIEIPSSARPEVVDAEVLRCLRERFPEVRAFEANAYNVGFRELTRTNPWKDE